MQKPRIVILVGPTAVGKSEIALTMAQKLNGEIVSADSMQIYQEMNIGTAKPSDYEQKIIKHHLINIISPKEKFTVADYVAKSQVSIAEILERNMLPIISGGTGLYINALIDGFLFPDQKADEQLRKDLQDQAENNPDEMYRKLTKVDPVAAKKLHPNDIRRVTRALEVFYSSGKPISELQAKAKPGEQKYEPLMIGLNRDREILYQRINNRVDTMVNQGLIDEVSDLLIKYPNQPTALQAIGYKEIALYLLNQITLDEAIDLIKRDTRRYAKRQISWFRRDQRIVWYNLEHVSDEHIIKETQDRLRKATVK